MLSPDAHIMTSQARMMSFEGRCKTFDAAADGYVRGEGCAFVVLERLEDALAANHRIMATIRGTASNQDGRSNGLTAPNAAAQEAVIRAALADGDVDPARVGFVECHGTGTTLGDPIEIGALQSVFGASRPPGATLKVQSVKTNIGHLEGAAGIAGLVKLVLALDRGALPVHLHLDEPNPYIGWNDIAVEPVVGPTPWQTEDGEPRVGGISSFGFSGTNVHMVLEQGPEPAGAGTGERAGTARVYSVSARTEDALRAAAGRHAAVLATEPLEQWEAAAATSMRGRAHLDERLAVVARGPDEASDLLRGYADGVTTPEQVFRGRRAPNDDGIVLLCTGQGSQAAGMGAALYAAEPVFKQRLDECAEILQGIADLDLLGVMFDGGATIDDTQFAQPALFAYEVALAALWQSWGVVPAAAIGHSIGEYAAAHLAGVLTLEDALRVVEARGRLMQQLPRDGGMAAVLGDPALVTTVVDQHRDLLSIAAVNGPRSLVVSGRSDALDAALTELEAAGVRTVRLEVSHAFHSPLMEPMLDDFEEVLGTVHFQDPVFELISNRTGQVAEPGELSTAAYWRAQVRDAVRFEASVRHAAELGYRSFLEVGPAPTLTGMAQGCELPSDVRWFAPGKDRAEEAVDVQRVAASLHVAGIPVDWRAYEEARGNGELVPVRLPTYPFEHTPYRHPAVAAGLRPGRAPAAAGGGTLLGTQMRSPQLVGSAFEQTLTPAMPRWLAEHVMYGVTIVPATAHLALMQMAAVADRGATDIADVRIDEPLTLSADGVVVQTVVDPDGTVSVHSDDGDRWRRHAFGHIADPTAGAIADQADGADRRRRVEEAWARCEARLEGADYYDALAGLGADYGPSFQLLDRAGRRDGEVVATLRQSELSDAGPVHPTLADACLQALGLAMPGGADLASVTGDVYLPVGVERWHVGEAAPHGELTALGTLRDSTGTDSTDADSPGPAPADVVVADLELVDAEGGLVLALHGVRFRRTPRSALVRRSDVDRFYTTSWVAGPAPERGDAAEGTWLVVGDAPLVEPIADGLRQLGATAMVVANGPAAAEALQVDDLRGVVWPLADEEPAVVTTAAVGALLDRLAVADRDVALTVVTRAALTVLPGDRAPHYEQAATWGLRRVAAAEYPRQFCRTIDLPDGDAGTGVAEHVLGEILADDREEPEIAYRDRVRYAHRLTRLATVATLEMPPAGYLLEVTERGRLDALTLVELPALAPGPGEVVIDVRATGLNFRDVLNVLGQYAGDAGSLGGECAGTVVAVGEGVHRVEAGDRVMAVADASFASRCVVVEEMVTRIPTAWSDAEAATVPITFLTADYALHVLGGMGPGDRVLIHAAAGGVGNAAVQLAQRAGAEIFATAGSDDKRSHLRALGVDHVYDSRSTDFGKQILADTDGAGVDLVLNSLSGDSIDASVAALSPTGRFVEIGMAGIWDEGRFHQVRPDAAYDVLYLGQVCIEQPQVIADRFDALVDAFEAGELRPLPLVAFDIRHSVEAFRYMAQARQIGKVVVTAAVGWEAVEGGGAWIISGGLGGLGSEVASALAANGASRLVLCSRRTPSGDDETTIERLRATGVEVSVVEVDVADRASVAAAVAVAVSDDMKLTGVVHAAGVLDDAMLRDLTVDRFEDVWAPKVVGAQHLAEECAPHHPEHFVLFSAGAALFGPPGQANYAAANAVLDAMAASRRAAGRPALAIDWGPWTTVGMAARLGDDAMRRWESQGIVGIRPEDGIEALRSAVGGSEAQVAVLDVRWSAMMHHFSKHGVPPILRDLVHAEQRRSLGTPAAASSVGLVDELRELDVDQRRPRVRAEVRSQLLQVLGLDDGFPLDDQQGLTDAGMDSLMAVEVSNRLSVIVGTTLPSTLAFEESTLERLSAHVEMLLSEIVELDRPPDESAETVGEDDDLDALSSDELADELLRELDEEGY